MRSVGRTKRMLLTLVHDALAHRPKTYCIFYNQGQIDTAALMICDILKSLELNHFYTRPSSTIKINVDDTERWIKFTTTDTLHRNPHFLHGITNAHVVYDHFQGDK